MDLAEAQCMRSHVRGERPPHPICQHQVIRLNLPVWLDGHIAGQEDRSRDPRCSESGAADASTESMC